MPIFDLTKKEPRWELKEPSGAGAAPRLMNVTYSKPPKRNLVQYADLYHTSPRLDALALIAEDTALCEFDVYDKRAWEKDPENAKPIAEHPAKMLLEKPSQLYPWFDGFALRFLTVIYKKLTGEALWLVEKNGNKPAEIYVIPSFWITSTPTINANYYTITPRGATDGKVLKIAPEDCVYFKELDILDPYGRGRGRSAEAIGDELETDEYASKHAKSFFYNDATPKTVVMMEGNPTQPDMDRIKAEWLKKYGGVGNANLPAFMGFKADIKQLSVTPKEMDFNESRRFLRDVINQHFSMPPEIMGILENSNRSTIDSAYYIYSKNVLDKEIKKEAVAINRQFMPMFGDNFIICFKNVVPEDDVFTLTKTNEGLARGAVMVNEWRLANGFKAVKNGDVFLRTFSTVEVPEGQNMPEPEPPTDSTPPEGEDVEIEPEEEDTIDIEPEDEEKEIDLANISTKGNKVFDDARRKAISIAVDKAAKKNEKLFQSVIGKTAKQQNKAVSDAFKGYINEGFTPAEASKLTLDDIFDLKLDEKLAKDLTPAWLTSMKEGYDVAQSVLGGGIDFSLVNPTFTQWVDEFGLDKSTLMNGTTKDSLRVKLTEDIANGASIPDMQKTIQAVYGDMEGYRAEMIARTESLTTVNVGQMATYKAGGISKKEWLTGVFDSETRDGHLKADGQVKNINDPFDIESEDGGTSALLFPGDPSAPAGDVINCRCTFLPVVED